MVSQLHPVMKGEIFGYLTKTVRTLPNASVPGMLSVHFGQKWIVDHCKYSILQADYLRWNQDVSPTLMICVSCLTPCPQQLYDDLFPEVRQYTLCMSTALCPVTQIKPNYICSSSSKIHLLFPNLSLPRTFSVLGYICILLNFQDKLCYWCSH